MHCGKMLNHMWDNTLANYCRSGVKTLWTFVLVLFVVTQSASAQTNAQCYSDANRAYQAILIQEARLAQRINNIKVNLNTATEGELASLNGIGSSKAQAIMLYREMFGPFATVDELTRVNGIGEKTLEKNRSRLQVN